MTPMVQRLELGRGDVPDRLEQSSMVEPVDPFERRELDLFNVPPRTVPPDDLGLVEADDGLRQGIVIGAGNTSHGRLDARLGQAPPSWIPGVRRRAEWRRTCSLTSSGTRRRRVPVVVCPIRLRISWAVAIREILLQLMDPRTFMRNHDGINTGYTKDVRSRDPRPSKFSRKGGFAFKS